MVLVRGVNLFGVARSLVVAVGMHDVKDVQSKIRVCRRLVAVDKLGGIGLRE